MNQRKRFVTPRVIQEAQVQLDRDLLQGSVQNTTKIVSMGIDVENYDFSEEIQDNPYTVEWD